MSTPCGRPTTSKPTPTTPTVQAALKAGHVALTGTSDSPRLDAELLLCPALRRERAWLYANPDACCGPDGHTVYRALLSRRTEGRPLAQLTGTKEFWSLPLTVSEFTLTPRPETEGLVEQALLRLPQKRLARVLDLGTGAGPIAIALATERAALTIVATDNSSSALEIARQNAARHAPGRIEFCEGNWFAALQNQQPFDMIISNPPYIGESEEDVTDRELRFEPTQALYSGKDGLAAIRHIVAHATTWLRPHGWLLLEHGYQQAGLISALFSAARLTTLSQHADLAGHARVSCAQRGADAEVTA